MTTSYASDFLAFIRQHNGVATKSSEQSTAAYTGSVHEHHGLSAPLLRGFVRDWSRGHAALTAEEFIDTLDDLYGGSSIEEHIFAGLVLGHWSKHRRALPLAKLEAWLGNLEGWAEVDSTCQSVFTAAELLDRWQEWLPFLRDLAKDANVNKRRAALVLLVLPIRESTDERLIALALKQIDTLKTDTDKRITKAISWLLREGVKRHRERIADYLAANRDTLPQTTQREVSTKLTTGKKASRQR